MNFGLIYQYVGTKEQLVREVYARAARDAAGRLADAEHLDEALAMLMTFGDGTTARLVGWAVLGGMQSEQLFRDSPALDVLAGPGAPPMRYEPVAGCRSKTRGCSRRMAMIVALGWRLFGGAALSAAGLDGARPERYDDRIREHLAALAGATTGATGRQAPRTARKRSIIALTCSGTSSWLKCPAPTV